LPDIFRFRGFIALPVARSLPEGLAEVRLVLGLSRRKMAAKLGVDPRTLPGWEGGRHQPTEESLGPMGTVLQIRWLSEQIRSAFALTDPQAARMFAPIFLIKTKRQPAQEPRFFIAERRI
jgi:transcriptional regulator with XRE-family HTH domain